MTKRGRTESDSRSCSYSSFGRRQTSERGYEQEQEHEHEQDVMNVGQDCWFDQSATMTINRLRSESCSCSCSNSGAGTFRSRGASRSTTL